MPGVLSFSLVIVTALLHLYIFTLSVKRFCGFFNTQKTQFSPINSVITTHKHAYLSLSHVYPIENVDPRIEVEKSVTKIV